MRKATPIPKATPNALALPAPQVAPAPADLFGHPPLIAGEDVAAYDALLARVTDTVAPADVLEAMWVRDVVDLAWETFRLRRLKAQLLTATADEGLEKLLARTLAWDKAENLARRWAAREDAALREVDKLLRRAGLTAETVTARTLALQIDEVERIDRMIMLAETRRDAVLREIPRHRADLAHSLRRAGMIEEAELEEVAAAAPLAGSPRRDERT
jgi:hypothetical protein